MSIRTKAYARAGLIGNPSDGYYGKTISFIVRNFHAGITLYETPNLEILPNQRDHSRFKNIHALAQDVRLFGYYGGIRLLKAAIKTFRDYCTEKGIALHNQNFTIHYESNIPGQVGMAGSSAIITACMRALMDFYQVKIPNPSLANLVLNVENKELGIPAGLQDRVIQVYEGLVYMDFNKELMAKQGYGDYEEIDPCLLPPVYVAYRSNLSEGTEVFHNDIRARFNQGEPTVVDAMKYWAHLAEQARALLLKKEGWKIAPLLNENFDKRREIYKISEENIRVVETARSVGASAKFTGSGGAIVGTYEDETMLARLVEYLGKIGVTVIKPIILPQEPI